MLRIEPGAWHGFFPSFTLVQKGGWDVAEATKLKSEQYGTAAGWI